MKCKNELILSTSSLWKISADTWLNWLSENNLKRIDFYGCSPHYSPFSYLTANSQRLNILKKWRERFEKKLIRVYSYTPEMRNYPLNLADTNEEIRCGSVAYCKSAILDADILGAHFVRIQAGYYYLNQNPDKAFSQLCRSMDTLLHFADQHNMMLLTGPDDYDITNVIYDCESTIALTEKFPVNNLAVIIPTYMVGGAKDPLAWYVNTLNKRISAFMLNTESSKIITELHKLDSDSQISSSLPVMLEFSGENNADHYLSSIQKGIIAVGLYTKNINNMEVNKKL